MADSPPQQALPLSGRRALVTGSTRGIGRVIALALARAGADVAIHGRRSKKAGEAARDEIISLGRQSILTLGDLRRVEEVDACVDALKDAWGGIDILVNNAALGSFREVTSLTPRQWDTTFNVSLRGAFLMSKAAAKSMSGWGRIINISSLGSARFVPGYGAMAAAKAGLEALTRTLAVELRPRGIIVNALSSGMVETDSLDVFPEEIQAQRADYYARSPSGRPGTPEDLAPIICFLCSDDAQWIVGQTLLADGGYSLL